MAGEFEVRRGAARGGHATGGTGRLRCRRQAAPAARMLHGDAANARRLRPQLPAYVFAVGSRKSVFKGCPGTRGASCASPARMPAVSSALHAPRCSAPPRVQIPPALPPSLATHRGDTELVSGPAGERPDWFWSGPKPVEGTPGVQPDGTITSLPAPNLASCTRQQVRPMCCSL